VVNGSLENGHCTDGESGKEGGREFDHMSSSAVSEMQASGNENGTLSVSVRSFVSIHTEWWHGLSHRLVAAEITTAVSYRSPQQY
jgi:hypothetical protein